MTHSSAPRVVIVDGLGTGRALLRELLNRNVECLHLRSGQRPGANIPDLPDYDGDLGFAGDVGDAIQLLCEFEPSAVVAGSVGAAAYAEAVAEGLGLPTNAIERFGARRHAQSLLLAARPDIDLTAAGSASLAHAPQLIVNSVSEAGAHRITDAWRLLDVQSGPAPGPGALELIDPSSGSARRLLDQTKTSLDDLGVRYGAAHSQLAGAGDAVRLVGATACLMSLPTPSSVWAHAGLQTQASMWAEDLARTARSSRTPVEPATYRPERSIAIGLFRFSQRARITGLEGLIRLRSLPSFRMHIGVPVVGHVMEPGSTWSAFGGLIFFIHDDPDQISADIRQFRAWEGRMELYGLTPLTGMRDDPKERQSAMQIPGGAGRSSEG